ncbi:DHA2 family efflux MFS transporter permease subunit [Alicyclobacillus dauci]|uniref:DHA2 family efflux MFS transporter permease subunit n=1 Tax=Alicyclobacillus dauci TaxID=1475485 RepID=A0ABY6Z5Y2_9BACL|nr:DHA2 family efflux MFS transporter permease subunit [Alicyclobacillus dauci]WAH37601.1 DHA2 family efflux MFS transporter permease subunit [Alicyclobacillus dauci]
MSQTKTSPDTGLNKGLILAVMVAGAFVAILNETLLNVALPPIMNELKITANTAQWLTTAYMLTNGVLIPVSAFLIQRFSTRTLFITAMGLFAAGTLIAAVAPDFAFLLVARVVQASGAAIMLPLLMNVVLSIFSVEERGGAMGIMGLVITFAPAIGPTLSGWIVGNHSWRVLFWIVLPIAVIDIIFAMVSLRNVTQLTAPKIDILSVVLSTFGFGGLLYGFSEAGNGGWNRATVIVSLAVALVGLVLFTWRQLSAKNPMLEFRVFRYNMFTLTTIISILITMTMFSAMLLLPLYLQNIRGFTPFRSGLLVLPGAILMGIMSPITGKIFDKIGARWLAVIGSALTVGTMFHFTRLTDSTTYLSLAISYAIMMFGMSLLMMPIMTAGLNQLPQRLNPHGTAMSNTLQQVAGAIGTALLVTVMTDQTKAQLTKLLASFGGNAAQLQQTAAQAASQAGAKVSQTPSASQAAMVTAMKHATIHGMNDAFMLATVIAALAFVLTFFIKRTHPPVEDSDAVHVEPEGRTKPRTLIEGT